MVAGARTSAQMRSASCPPIPPDVIVGPAARPPTMKLRQQAASGVQLVYSHDPVQWPTLTAAL